MKKTVLATAAIALTLVTFSSAMAANSTAPSSDNKFKAGAQSVGRAIMWGPKKIGSGLSKLGTGIKNKFHHS